MPLVKRHVEPVKLANRKIPNNSSNELELVTNSTLSGTLNQLSSLSFYAQDVFAELGVEVQEIGERIDSMQHRVQEVDNRVSILSQGGKDIKSNNTSSPRKNNNNTTARVLDRSTMPEEMLNYYNNTCQPPPNLNIFDSCRPDNDPVSNSLKLYTDPDFFFELWRDKIQQANRMDLQRRQKNKKRNVSRMQRKPSATGIEVPATRREQWKQQGQGKELAEFHTMKNNSRKQLVNGNHQYYGQNGINQFQTLPSKTSNSTPISSNFSPTSPVKQNSNISSSSNSNVKNYNLNEHPLHNNNSVAGLPPPIPPSKLSPVKKNFNSMPAPPPPPSSNNMQKTTHNDHFNSNLKPLSNYNNNSNPAVVQQSQFIQPDNTSNIGRQTSISKLPPPPPTTLNYENVESNSENFIISPPMPSPPKTEQQGGNVHKPLFPAHVVNPNSNTTIPPPPPIDNFEITNKFADLTLSRPKKVNTNKLHDVPSQSQKSPTSSVSSGGGGDARSNLLAEIRKGKQLRKMIFKKR